MHFTSVALAAIAAFTPLAAAVGHATVENHCKDNSYLWSVGASAGDQHIIKPGEHYSEKYHTDPKTGGIALKITRVEGGIYNGSPQTIFAYTLDGDRVFYDLSDVFGDPFKGESVVLKPSDPNCTPIIWENGVLPVVTHDTHDCSSDADLTLTLC